METWLVAHDFSECGDAAADLAGRFANCDGAKILLLHIHPFEHVRPEHQSGQVTYDDEKGLEAKLAKVVDRLMDRHPHLNIEVRIAQGNPHELILDEADRESVNYIAVGTHGRTGVAHLLLGSVAERVVRHAKVPVLVAKVP